ncbi:MAG: tetratricopeptide repeat protein [Pyrinomonadaceae bacterium]
MKNQIAALFVLVLFALSISAQKITKPTLTPVKLTPQQQLAIEEGIRLHDEKKYDEAIKAYERVLSENPDSTLAMYELALTCYTKGDKEKAIEMAVRGSKYVSSELPLFYLTIANVIDDVGKPDEAVQIYKDALKILNSEKGLSQHLSSVHYNLGVTYVKQKKYPEARETLKKAVEHNNSYSSPHYLLALVYNGTKYKLPAFLAAARHISLEPNTARTDPSAGIIKGVLEPAEKNEKTGNITINLDFSAPKDEGDFAIFDLFLGTMMSVKSDKDKGKSLEDIFAESIDSVIGLLAEDKKLKSTFVGKNYIPFVAEMKARGHSRAFAYLVLYKTGNDKALKWLTENEAKLRDFLAWGKAYAPPGN